MTNSPKSNHHFNCHKNYRKNKHFWLLVLSRGSIALGGLLLVGLVGGALSLVAFIDKDLAPLASKNLTTTLNRPVKLGEVKEVSLTKVRFGASAIPATPTDPDSVAVDTVDVRFDLLQLLLQRKLKLDVTLVNANVYVEQDAKGRWISTSLAAPSQAGPIKTDLGNLRFRNAKLVLVPQPRKQGQDEISPTPSTPSTSPVTFSEVNGYAQLRQKNQVIWFDVGGKPANGGNIYLKGETRPKTQAANLQVRGQDLLASDITDIVKLPVDLQAGRVKGDLQIQLLSEQQPAIIFGVAHLQGVKIQVPRVPQAFVNSQGNLSFQGKQITLEKVAANYGKIPLLASGTIDREAGYKLVAGVKAVSVTNAQETLKIKLPLPTSGELKADLQFTGPTVKPILSGTVATIKPARIDKVDFNSVRARFDFSPVASLVTIKDIQGKATVGGEVTGSGTVRVGKNPQVNFNLTAKNVPGDAIAKIYDITPSFVIGTLTGTAQLTGTDKNVQTYTQWQAPQATYPGTGETIIAPDKTVSFRNVAVSVAGGTVQGSGSWVDGRWQAVADASKVQVEPFVNSNQLQNISLKQAQFNGRLILSGTSGPFDIATIKTENAKVQLGGGTVAVSNIQLGEQSFSAQLVADNVRLGRVLKQSLPAFFYPLAGTFQVSGNTDSLGLKTLRATGDARLAVGGGTITAANIQLADGVYQTQLRANQVQVQELAQLPQQIQGALTGDFQVAGNVESFQLQAIQATGKGRLAIGGGTITATNFQLANGRYQTQLQANQVKVQQLAQLPPQIQGALTGDFQVAGGVDSFQPQAIQATGKGQLAIAGGTITATNFQLANGRYQTQLQANQVKVQQLAPVPKQFQGALTGDFNVAGGVDSFQPQNIQATGQGKLAIGGGTITATNFQLANGRYQTQLQGNNVPLQRLAPVPPQFQGALTGDFQVAGAVNSLQPQNIQASGQGKLNLLTGGTVTASNIQLANGRYQTVVDAQGVQLNRLNQELRGKFGGKLEVAGKVGAFNVADLRGVGQVQFSQGIGGIEQPLSASVAWNGQKLTIEQATSPDLNASGYILAKATSAGIPEITQLNLNVQAQNYNLQKLPLKLPNAVAVVGKADFGGQITGKLPVPNLQGQLRLRDLVVNKLPFESVLAGNIQLEQGRGINLDVAGTKDRIAFNLDANNRPNSFTVRRDQAIATGQSQGDNLAVKVENFPLGILKLTPPANNRLGGGVIAGVLTGDLQINQKTFATAGNVAIAQPEIGRIKGDRFTGQFSYGNNKASLTGGEFLKGNSRYNLAGNFTQTTKGPQFQGKLNVSQGNIQDVLTALQLFELQDVQRGLETPTYGKATDLTTLPVGLLDQPLLRQIERFSEIEALLPQQQEQRQSNSLIPNLADLKGTFNGEVTANNLTAKGLAVNFNLNGQNFDWGRKEEPGRYYHADSVIAEGNFENGVLRLLPLRVESKNRLIAFTGNIGGKEQSGQLRVNNFPLGVLNNFVKLPVGFTGNLNATAALAGSIANPQAKGELQITDGTLNKKKVDAAAASFSYANGRLNFGSKVIVSGPEPVDINGSIPYQLPFAAAIPDSNDIQLDVKLKNEGLAVLNLFTNQAAFETGEGQIDLTVRGTIKNPVVDGVATVNNATFSAQALPGQLTDVTGKVLFNFDSILVENLQGKYSRGKVQAAGEIAIANNQQVQINNPLNVTLDELALNLKGLYQGGASGKLQITGAALTPIIGGKVRLTNGEVLLADANTTTPPRIGVLPAKATKLNNPINKQVENGVTRFNNLELQLGKNVQIIRPPILNFRATGDLKLNGSLNDLSPSGTIRLRQGGVNLFSTQLVLTRGYKHKATFSEGLDPFLDIRLAAKVSEAPQNQVTASPLSAEINEGIVPNFEPIKTVNVEARIEGLASQLSENIELTSNPARSQTEIVALLGGGFVDTLGRGDSTLALANLAGSALNLQGTVTQIGNAFGLSELRLFPTIIPNDNNPKKNSPLQLAAEAGIDLFRGFSFSAIQILTDNQPTQFGINYRINENLRVRGSTAVFCNPNDRDYTANLCDSRAVFEYEKRF